jgi:hypothetical protein
MVLHNSINQVMTSGVKEMLPSTFRLSVKIWGFVYFCREWGTTRAGDLTVNSLTSQSQVLLIFSWLTFINGAIVVTSVLHRLSRNTESFRSLPSQRIWKKIRVIWATKEAAALPWWPSRNGRNASPTPISLQPACPVEDPPSATHCRFIDRNGRRITPRHASPCFNRFARQDVRLNTKIIIII